MMESSPILVSVGSLLLVLVAMLAESALSRRNEGRLRARGAIEPPGDVYRWMQWMYPGAFVAMAVEGAVAGPQPGLTTVAGALLLVGSKVLKYWAIVSLGPRWTFRVLVPPGAAMVTAGPYSRVRHPNYLAVVGELVGMALLVGAAVAGPIATATFGLLLRRRIRVENAALRYPACSSRTAGLRDT